MHWVAPGKSPGLISSISPLDVPVKIVLLAVPRSRLTALGPPELPRITLPDEIGGVAVGGVVGVIVGVAVGGVVGVIVGVAVGGVVGVIVGIVVGWVVSLAVRDAVGLPRGVAEGVAIGSILVKL